MDKTSGTFNVELSQGHMRIASLHSLSKLLRAFGVNPDQVLHPLKLTEDYLANPDNVLPISHVGELLHRAVQETGCEHFGLLIGSQSRTKELGIPGRLILLCPSVALALETLRRYLHLHQRGAIPIVHCQGNMAMLGYALLESNFPGIQEIQDGAMAIALNIMRDLLGPQWCPAEVHLMRRAPRHPQVYADFFGAPCCFDAGCSELVFPSATLDSPVLGELPTTRTAEAMSAGELTPADQNWIEHVRRTALALLLTGNCTRKAVAETMGISERTLNRKLEKEGGSFLEIADHSRYAASRMLIKETDMSLASIARLLGYSDPSSFSRAFKRWSGLAPLAWRNTKIPPLLPQEG